MAHMELFSTELSPDEPAGQSYFSRREDLQGIMGPPAPIRFTSLLDSPKPETVSTIPPHSLYLSPSLGSGPPVLAPRVFIPYPPSWPENQRKGSRPSLVPEPKPGSISHLGTEQDVWSPLRVTGLPPLRPKSQIPQPLTPISDNTSPSSTVPSHDSFQNSVSELGTQVNGYPYLGSGYGTRSVVSSKSAASSFPIEFDRDIRYFPPDNHRRNAEAAASEPELTPRYISRSSGTAPPRRDQLSPYPSIAGPGDNADQPLLQCGIPGCIWTGKCPSDKRKHMLRHQKPFLCEEHGCTRKIGFGTLNDLERHRRCVHGIVSRERPSKRFKCFAENCVRGDQIWPRFDNFRQHLLRMHRDLKTDELLRRSNEWYESSKKQQDSSTRSSQEPSVYDDQQKRNTLQRDDASSVADIASYTSGPDIREANVATVQPATLYNDTSSLPFSGTGGLSYSRPRPFGSIDGSSRMSVDFAPSILSTDEHCQAEQNNTHHDWGHVNPYRQQQDWLNPPQPIGGIRSSPLFRDIHWDNLELPGTDSVKGSAMGLLKALEKETENVVSWKRSPGEDVDRALDSGDGAPSFIDLLKASGEEERNFLQNLVRAGYEQLARQVTGPSGARETEQGGSERGRRQQLPDIDKPYECGHEGCKKRTKRQCEMRKHEIRHRRPYSCTFTNCTKSFGSKNDWKRHENTRHFQHQSWLCQEPVRSVGDGKTKECGQDFSRRNSFVDHLRDGDEKTKECGQGFSRRNIFVDHLRDAHGVVTDIGIKESLKRSRIGPNGQAKFWCGFCKTPRDLKSQGLKAIDERFDHIDEHLKQGMVIKNWIPPPHENILKNTNQNDRSSSDESIQSGEKGTAVEGGRKRARLPTYGFDPPSVHVTQTTSYERGRPPAKRPQTTSTSPILPHGQERSPVTDPRIQPASAITPTATTRNNEHPTTIWAPGKHTNQEIIESLIYMSDPPPTLDPVYITCCRCPVEPFPSRYEYKIQPYCAVCNHRACNQCASHYRKEPTSEDLCNANEAAVRDGLI